MSDNSGKGSANQGVVDAGFNSGNLAFGALYAGTGLGYIFWIWIIFKIVQPGLGLVNSRFQLPGIG